MPPERLSHGRQACHPRGHLWVIFTLAAFHLEKPQEQWLGRGIGGLLQVDAGQVIEEEDHIRVIGADRTVTDFQSLAEVLFRLRVVSSVQFKRALPEERSEIGLRAVVRVTERSRRADYPIRCPAVGADDWGIASRLNTALEACCGVSHGLDLQRSSSQQRAPGAKS